jgi:RNA polymerase-binding transcription factor DksA
MVSTDLAMRVAARLSACPVEDLPRCRDRLERLWRLQVEEIIELSVAYHDTASAPGTGAGPDPVGSRARQFRQILAGISRAHHGLAEIEAAMGRIGTASYGICENCGLPLQASWLDACPQVRYCEACHPAQGGRRG